MSAEPISKLPFEGVASYPEQTIDYGDIPLGWRKTAEGMGRSLFGMHDSSEVIYETLSAGEEMFKDKVIAGRLVAFWHLMPQKADGLRFDNPTLRVKKKLAGDLGARVIDFSTEGQLRRYNPDNEAVNTMLRKATNITSGVFRQTLGDYVDRRETIARVVTQEIVFSKPGLREVSFGQEVLKELFETDVDALDSHLELLRNNQYLV